MRVAAYELDSAREPHMYVQHGQVLAMALRPGSTFWFWRFLTLR
jgi:hypothetical protein